MHLKPKIKHNLLKLNPRFAGLKPISGAIMQLLLSESTREEMKILCKKKHQTPDYELLLCGIASLELEIYVDTKNLRRDSFIAYLNDQQKDKLYAFIRDNLAPYLKINISDEKIKEIVYGNVKFYVPVQQVSRINNDIRPLYEFCKLKMQNVHVNTIANYPYKSALEPLDSADNVLRVWDVLEKNTGERLELDSNDLERLMGMPLVGCLEKLTRTNNNLPYSIPTTLSEDL